MNTKYVTSLELSKKLKEAGVKQESEWYWTNYGNPNKEAFYLVSKNESEVPEIQHSFEQDGFKEEIYSAFHVGELGEMLPKEIKGLGELKHEWTGNGNPTLWYGDVSNGSWKTDSTEAEARGKMVLYLKENKLI